MNADLVFTQSGNLLDDIKALCMDAIKPQE